MLPLELLHNHRALNAGIGGNLAHRLLKGLEHNGSAGLLVALGSVHIGLHSRDGVNQGSAAASHDALFHSGLGGSQSVLNAQLLFLHLNLSGSAHLDDSNTAGQLGQPLLELLLIELAGGGLNLRANLSHTALDGRGISSAVHNDGVLLVHLHLAGAAQLVNGGVLQIQAHFLRDDLAAGQGGNVHQHLLAAVTEAGSLYGHAHKGAPQAVENQGGQGLALNVLSNNQQLFAGLDNLLQQGQNLLDIGNLLVSNQDVGLIQISHHLVRVCGHIGGHIAPVEHHALNHLAVGLGGLALLHSDNTVRGDLLHGVSNQLANLVAAGGNSGHAGNVLLHALAQHHGVGSGGHVLHALPDQGLGQQGGGGGAVASHIIGLGGNLFHQLGAHVLISVLQLHLFGNGHTVIGNQGGAELLIQHHVAALGAQGDFHSVGQLVDAAEQRLAGLLAVYDFLSHT